MAGSPIKRMRKEGIDIPPLTRPAKGTVKQAVARARACRTYNATNVQPPEELHLVALGVLRDFALATKKDFKVAPELRIKAADALGKMTKQEQRQGLVIEGLSGTELVRLEVEARRVMQLPPAPTLASIDVEAEEVKP